MPVIETLRKERVTKDTKSPKQKLKVDFDGNIKEEINKIIEYNKKDYGIELQLLSAKEIQNIIQKNFSLLEFEVMEVESDTSKKMSKFFAPERYNIEPVNDDFKTFLDDLYASNDIEVFEEGKKSWSRTKVKMSLKKDSEYYTSDKTYSVGNTPKAIKINIKRDGKNLISRPIFTIPGVDISNEKTINEIYRNIAIGGKYEGLPEYKSADYADDNLYKVHDLNYLIAICILLETSFQYLDRDVSFLYNEKNSYYGLNYTIEDVLSLMDLEFLSKRFSSLKKETIHLIAECVIAVTHIKTSQLLSMNYNKDLTSEYARSFETKKNIPTKYKSIMKNNDYLEYFKFVELDELTDIEKFYLVENEFNVIKDILDLNRFIKKDAELRFRRLGQHRATGLYYPQLNCVCVDINKPSSFIHELAHLIDHRYNHNYNLSNDGDFRLLAIEYKRALETTALTLSGDAESKASINRYRRKRGYYHTPTELFARAFELYLVVIKKMKSSLLPKVEELTLENGYPVITESLANKIAAYFSDMFNIEENIDTTVSEAENTLLTLGEPIIEEVAVSDTDTNTRPIRGARTRTIATSSDRAEAIIEPAHNGDKANYIFKIINDSIVIDDEVRFKTRRRGKLNRNPVDEERNTIQLQLF